MDEFIDELLHSDRCCDVIMPRIQVCMYVCTKYISVLMYTSMYCTVHPLILVSHHKLPPSSVIMCKLLKY